MISLVNNAKLAILIVILFCTSFTALLWYQQAKLLRSNKGTIIEQAVQRNSNLALTLENYTLRTIQNAGLVLQTVKSAFEKTKSPESIKAFLKTPAVDSSLFSGITIADAEGNLLFSNLKYASDTTVNFSEREFFNFHKTNNEDELYLSKPVISKALGVGVIHISRRITNADGTFGGIIFLQIIPSTFTAFYEKAILNKYDIVSLIAPDGITYARQTGSVPSYGEDISKSPLFTHLKTNAIGSYFAKDAIRGIPTYFSYRKFSNYPVIATVGTTEFDVLKDFEKRKKHELIFTACITGLIILFALLACIGIMHRKKYLTLLSENEEKYRLMFEYSTEAILLLNLKGEITDINPAAGELFDIILNKKEPTSFASLTGISAGGILNLPSEEIKFTGTDGAQHTGEISTAAYFSAVEKRKVILVAIRDTTEKKRLQEELLNEKNSRQQLITKQVIQAQERERTIIGGELHDNICQILTTIKIYLNLSIKNNERGKEFLPKSMELLEMAIAEIRNLSHTLSAPTLGKKSLVASITELLTDVNIHSGIITNFNCTGDVGKINIEHKLAIFRIVQEQVNNILKHAAATIITVSLSAEGGNTHLTIQDNGKGFNPSEESKGIGLNNIEARAKAFAGHAEIISTPGNGCILKVQFPLN